MDLASLSAMQGLVLGLAVGISGIIFGIWDRRRAAKKEEFEGTSSYRKDVAANWLALIEDKNREIAALRKERDEDRREVEILWATVHEVSRQANMVRHAAVNRLFTKFLIRKQTEPNAVFTDLPGIPSAHSIYEEIRKTKD